MQKERDAKAEEAATDGTLPIFGGAPAILQGSLRHGFDMPRIFVSYRREDSAGQAGRLSDRLSAAFGASQVFMDVDDIPLVEDFVATLRRSIEAADVALVVIGPRWLTATDGQGQRRLDDEQDLVRREVSHALASRKRVVPVLLNGVGMPKAPDLPGPLQTLALCQAFTPPPAPVPAVADADVTGNWEADVFYEWDKRTVREPFSFRFVGGQLVGSAGFLGYPRGIVSGEVKGQTIIFETRSQARINGKEVEYAGHRGSGDSWRTNAMVKLTALVMVPLALLLGPERDG